MQKTLPKAWRIGDQGAELERIFKSDKIQQIVFHQDDHPPFAVHHVPVDHALRDRVQSLNDLLHAQDRFKKFYNRWWVLARDRVVDAYRRAWICCQGTLLSPVFDTGGDGQLSGQIQMELNTPEAEAFAKTLGAGKRFVAKIDYLPVAPTEWVPDL